MLYLSHYAYLDDAFKSTTDIFEFYCTAMDLGREIRRTARIADPEIRIERLNELGNIHDSIRTQVAAEQKAITLSYEDAEKRNPPNFWNSSDKYKPAMNKLLFVVGISAATEIAVGILTKNPVLWTLSNIPFSIATLSFVGMAFKVIKSDLALSKQILDCTLLAHQKNITSYKLSLLDNAAAPIRPYTQTSSDAAEGLIPG